MKKGLNKQLIMTLFTVVQVAIATGIFAVIWFNEYAYAETMVEPFWNRGNYVVIGQYLLMTCLFHRVFGNFRVGSVRTFEAMYTQVMAICCTNFITYLQLCLICRWAFLENILPIISMTVVNMVLAVLFVVFKRFTYVRINPPQELLLVYGQYSPDRLIEKLDSHNDKYTVKETISIEEKEEDIIARLEQYEGVILADIPADLRNTLLKACFKRNIRCYSVPKISDIMIMNAESIHLFDTALLLFRNAGLSVGQQIRKRLFDILVSLVATIVTSPIMLIIGICVKCGDGGSVFYRQTRLTKDGKEFSILKFRSMKETEETEEVCMTREGDTRITPVGKILRASHLDELPQLINILKGDMSLVGPRPECPQIAEEYEQFLPEFPFRLKVKAGLTGYAQVYGQYSTTPYDKLKLDLQYIEKYSFWLDIKLILLTVRFFFKSNRVEGIQSWQRTAATEENLKQVKENEHKEC